MAQSLREIGMNSAVDLFSTYAGMKSDLAPWLADAAINRDRNLRLQYLAGLGLNLYQSDAIYADMLQYRRYPDELFVGIRRNDAGAARGHPAHAGEVGVSTGRGQLRPHGPPEKTLDVVERQLPARAERDRVEGMLRPRQFQQDRRRPGGAKLPMERRAE